jgi:hypothetical protein
MFDCNHGHDGMEEKKWKKLFIIIIIAIANDSTLLSIIL